MFAEKLKRYQKLGKTIVYLDESGFAQSMPRTHGYAPKGARCFGTHDWHAKGRVNAIGAIIKMAFVTLNLVTGNLNAEAFHAWVTQALLPKVEKGAIIVMDNAPFHKRADTAKAIAEHGCIVEWLPPYSPDLNPIEHMWSKAKAVRRALRCSVDVLFSKHMPYVKLK